MRSIKMKLGRGSRAALEFGLTLTLISLGMTGCVSRSQNQDTTPASAAGAKMQQQQGTMSQNDYVRADGLAHQVYQTHAISDTDLDWTVTHLNMQKNSIARARFFNTLYEIRPMSAAQQAKILPAITPYLTSADRLDQIGAQRVQKAMQAAS